MVCKEECTKEILVINNAFQDVILSKEIKDEELKEKLRYILRSSNADDIEDLYWCGCYEGDIREYFEDRREQAVEDLIKLIKKLY